MPSGVGAFHSGIEFGANKYRSEQAAAAKMAGEAADDRRLNLNDFFARIGELEKALAPDKFDPQMEESLLAKAQEIDRQYGDVTELRATRMVLSRLGRKTPLTAEQKIGTIGNVPAPAPSPNAGFPSAIAKSKYETATTTAQQDALYAKEGGILTQQWVQDIENSGGLDDPNIMDTVARLTGEAAARYGNKNAEAMSKQMRALVEDRLSAMREARLAEKAAAGKGIDPDELRRTTESSLKWVELSALGGKPGIAGEIEVNLNGTQVMRATLQRNLFRMVGKGKRADEINARLLEMYGDSTGVIPKVVTTPPVPWLQTVPQATERQRELIRALYASDAYDPTEWQPVVMNGELAMVNKDTGAVSIPKTSAGTVGVPDALRAPEPVEESPVPLPGVPKELQPPAPAAPAGPPSPLDKSLRGMGKGIEGTAAGIGAAAEGVKKAGVAVGGGLDYLLEMITRGGTGR